MNDEEYLEFRSYALERIARDPKTRSARAIENLLQYVDHLRGERIISAHWVYQRVLSMLSAKDREILELEWQQKGGAE